MNAAKRANLRAARHGKFVTTDQVVAAYGAKRKRAVAAGRAAQDPAHS